MMTDLSRWQYTILGVLPNKGDGLFTGEVTGKLGLSGHNKKQRNLLSKDLHDLEHLGFAARVAGTHIDCWKLTAKGVDALKQMEAGPE